MTNNSNSQGVPVQGGQNTPGGQIGGVVGTGTNMTSQQRDVAGQSAVSGPDKEQAPIGPKAPEVAQTVEVTADQEIPLEVREYMEKVDKENLELDRPIVHHGQAVVSPSHGGNQTDIVLPITKAAMIVGLKQKVTTSLRWLTTWCLRIIKKFHGRVIYSSEGHRGSDGSKE